MGDHGNGPGPPTRKMMKMLGTLLLMLTASNSGKIVISYSCRWKQRDILLIYEYDLKTNKTSAMSHYIIMGFSFVQIIPPSPMVSHSLNFHSNRQTEKRTHYLVTYLVCIPNASHTWCGDGSFRINSKCPPTDGGWYLEWTRKLPTLINLWDITLF